MKCIVPFLLALALILTTVPAMAKDAKMIFWYPGEAGSTIEGQPVLDAFFEYLNTKIAPDKITGKYFNSVDAGISYIKTERPSVGIISYAAWAQNKGKFGPATVILSTLPSPDGKSAESYSLVGTSDKIPAGAVILSSEPLTLSFVQMELFPSIPADVKLAQTGQMLFKLKEIAEGKFKGLAILTPTEARSLKMISAAWSQTLKIIGQSKPVPTARVVLFDDKWNDTEKFKSALLETAKDPQTKDILSEMRLTGFGQK